MLAFGAVKGAPAPPPLYKVRVESAAEKRRGDGAEQQQQEARKRPEASGGAPVSVRASHLLVKHCKSRNPSSWKVRSKAWLWVREPAQLRRRPLAGMQQGRNLAPHWWRPCGRRHECHRARRWTQRPDSMRHLFPPTGKGGHAQPGGGAADDPGARRAPGAHGLPCMQAVHVRTPGGAARLPCAPCSHRATPRPACPLHAQAFHAQLTSGDPSPEELASRFSELASVESHCSSARRGGDLGQFGWVAPG